MKDLQTWRTASLFRYADLLEEVQDVRFIYMLHLNAKYLHEFLKLHFNVTLKACKVFSHLAIYNNLQKS